MSWSLGPTLHLLRVFSLTTSVTIQAESVGGPETRPALSQRNQEEATQFGGDQLLVEGYKAADGEVVATIGAQCSVCD